MYSNVSFIIRTPKAPSGTIVVVDTFALVADMIDAKVSPSKATMWRQTKNQGVRLFDPNFGESFSTSLEHLF